MAHPYPLIVVRFFGFLPLTLKGSAFQVSNTLKNCSKFILFFTLLSFITRVYIELVINPKIYFGTFIYLKLIQLDPIICLIYLIAIMCTNLCSSLLEKQANFLNLAFQFQTSKFQVRRYTLFLLLFGTPVIVLISSMYYLFKSDIFVEDLNVILTLIVTWTLDAQRFKIVFYMKLMKQEVFYIENCLRSNKITVEQLEKHLAEYKILLKSFNLFRDLVQPYTYFFNFYLFTCSIMGLSAFKPLLEDNRSENWGFHEQMNEVASGVWYLWSIPIAIWMMNAGETIENKVGYCIIAEDSLNQVPLIHTAEIRDFEV